MKTKFAATALILASGLIAGTPSFAESSRTDDVYAIGAITAEHAQSGVTREQVKAELAQAVRTGDIIDVRVGGEILVKRNELYPNRYPTKEVQSSVTREQVKAELGEAVRNGEIRVAKGSDR